MKRKGRITLVLLLVLVLAFAAGDWMLTMVPASDAAVGSDDWPSKVVGPTCQQIARERRIPQDLADHTCEAIKS